MKQKPKLLIRGNLLITKCLQMLTGGKLDIISLANESEYDLSETIIIEGDVTIDSLQIDGLALVTGGFTILREGGCHE